MTFPSLRTRVSLLVAAVLAMAGTANAQNNPFASLVTPGSNNTPSKGVPPPPQKPAQDAPRPVVNPFAGLPAAVQNSTAPKPAAPQATPASSGNTTPAIPSSAPSAVTPPLTGAASHPQAQLGILEQRNVFDPKRTLWPDRVPPPPAPPPPPPPPPITDADMQLYGVVLAGSVKRATVKLGGKFAGLTQGKRPFLTLMEGQVLGEYTVGEIRANELVMLAGTGRQAVVFTKKTDRPAAGAAAPPVVQAAQVAAPVALQAPQAPLNPLGVGLPTPVVPTNIPAAPAAEAAVATQPNTAPTAANAAQAASPAASAASIAPPNSLAAAIAAAQAAAQAGKPAVANPFTAP